MSHILEEQDIIIIIIFYLDIPLYNGGNLSRGNWVASR